MDDKVEGWVQCKHSVYHTNGVPPMCMQPEIQTKALRILGYACHVQVLNWLQKDFPQRCKWAGANSKTDDRPTSKWLEVKKEMEKEEPFSPFSPLDKAVTLG